MPRETAARLLKNAGEERERRIAAIREADSPIALQMLSLLQAGKEDITGIISELESVHPAFRKYAKYLRKVKKGKREHDH